MEPRYQVRDIDMYFSDYSRNLARVGVVPVEIPYDANANDLMEHLDGLLVTGGQDIGPTLWGGGEGDARDDVDFRRDSYEIGMVAAAQTARVPILGICRGMQLLNVSRGGSLIADLDAAPIDHTSPGHPVEHIVHDVETDVGSLARQVFGLSFSVNSLHHQAVDRPGEGVSISGRSADGVPEVIEVPGLPWLGVQWHPEWMPEEDPSFEWLAAEAWSVVARKLQSVRT